MPRIAGCIPPSDPWIDYSKGRTTNVPGPENMVQRVEDAFACIAQLGTEGCMFEQPLEAARRALDPVLNINPGFLRHEALLAIIFLTDEDDCSVEKAGLFEPLNKSLGPLGSFRCTQFGWECDQRLDQPGIKEGCEPGGDWLYKVADYVRFFETLKPPGRVVMAAFAGPASEPVQVELQEGKLALSSSCSSVLGSATPALRLKKVVEAFGQNGQFNAGGATICNDNFHRGLPRIPELFRFAETDRCLQRPLATKSGALACWQGDLLGEGPDGAPVLCQESCLPDVDCEANLVRHAWGGTEPILRCEDSAFENPWDPFCHARCPCWRVVPRGYKLQEDLGSCASYYKFEVLLSEDLPQGTIAEVRCRGINKKWGELADYPQCHEAASDP